MTEDSSESNITILQAMDIHLHNHILWKIYVTSNKIYTVFVRGFLPHL